MNSFSAEHKLRLYFYARYLANISHSSHLYDPLIAEVLVAPLLDVANALDGGDSVVGNEDLGDDAGSAEALHQLLGRRRPLHTQVASRLVQVPGS